MHEMISDGLVRFQHCNTQYCNTQFCR